MGYPFSLVLHTHLPMVVNHGRWPHGSDWLCEATFECYLPLLDTAHRLVADGISPKWTLNISPILTEQLASPEFQKELAFYYENVRRACVESREEFTKEGRNDLIRLTHFWGDFYERMWELHRRIGGDIVGTFSELQRQGHLELITCGATHGYLPLLSRDESIHLQLRTAVETLRRRVHPRPEEHAAGVEPRARLPGRLPVSRVSQEALSGRAAVLADHGRVGGSRQEAALRSRDRRGAHQAAGPSLRGALARHAA